MEIRKINFIGENIKDLFSCDRVCFSWGFRVWLFSISTAIMEPFLSLYLNEKYCIIRVFPVRLLSKSGIHFTVFFKFF